MRTPTGPFIKRYELVIILAAVMVGLIAAGLRIIA